MTYRPFGNPLGHGSNARREYGRSVNGSRDADEYRQFLAEVTGDRTFTAQGQRDLLDFVADITGTSRQAWDATPKPLERPRAGGPLQEIAWDPAKHPRGGNSRNRGYFSLTWGPSGQMTTPAQPKDSRPDFDHALAQATARGIQPRQPTQPTQRPRDRVAPIQGPNWGEPSGDIDVPQWQPGYVDYDSALPDQKVDQRIAQNRAAEMRKQTADAAQRARDAGVPESAIRAVLYRDYSQNAAGDSPHKQRLQALDDLTWRAKNPELAARLDAIRTLPFVQRAAALGQVLRDYQDGKLDRPRASQSGPPQLDKLSTSGVRLNRSADTTPHGSPGRPVVKGAGSRDGGSGGPVSGAGNRIAAGGDEGGDSPPQLTPRNAHLAGKNHPVTGIPFNEDGYPDFSSVAAYTVKIRHTGDYRADRAAANRAAGLESTPKGYSWHHHQDGTTMQLVPTHIHAKTGHTGGMAAGGS